MSDLRNKIADLITNELFERFTSPSAAVIGVNLADRILALVPAKTCDLCDEPAGTLRCNECAQIMASDY